MYSMTCLCSAVSSVRLSAGGFLRGSIDLSGLIWIATPLPVVASPLSLIALALYLDSNLLRALRCEERNWFAGSCAIFYADLAPHRARVDAKVFWIQRVGAGYRF